MATVEAPVSVQTVAAPLKSPRPIPSRRLRRAPLPAWATEFDESACAGDVRELHDRLRAAGVPLESLLGAHTVSAVRPVPLTSIATAETVATGDGVTDTQPPPDSDDSLGMSSPEAKRQRTGEAPVLDARRRAPKLPATVQKGEGGQQADTTDGESSGEALATDHAVAQKEGREAEAGVAKHEVADASTAEDVSAPGVKARNYGAVAAERNRYEEYHLNGDFDEEAVKQLQAPFGPAGVDMDDLAWGTFARRHKRVMKKAAS
ncbi:hypothetical protein CDCA_CDCA04G1438 [Cyanidium caldarium]|uniref:Uncharacterized protein n=1 Tax=Cyanidium caldarium TaxID=2771 RepID=A0AAV9IU84_CYACA|nr:hypothetical protein CDCA_CDCA04G1438 [Cyanidium caldarium]